MSYNIRTLILALVAVVVLPIIFVAVQGFLATFSVTMILVLRGIVGSSVAVFLVNYGFGVVGSALSAMITIFPLGMMLVGRPSLVGAAVGILAVAVLVIMTQNVSVSVSIEYLVVVILSIYACRLGYAFKNPRPAS